MSATGESVSTDAESIDKSSTSHPDAESGESTSSVAGSGESSPESTGFVAVMPTRQSAAMIYRATKVSRPASGAGSGKSGSKLTGSVASSSVPLSVQTTEFDGNDIKESGGSEKTGSSEKLTTPAGIEFVDEPTKRHDGSSGSGSGESESAETDEKSVIGATTGPSTDEGED